MKLSFLLSNLISTESDKVRLEKQETKDYAFYSKKFNRFIEEYFPTIVFIVLFIVLILFVWVCFVSVGSMTESGVYYNHLGDAVRLIK